MSDLNEQLAYQARRQQLGECESRHPDNSAMKCGHTANHGYSHVYYPLRILMEAGNFKSMVLVTVYWANEEAA